VRNPFRVAAAISFALSLIAQAAHAAPGVIRDLPYGGDSHQRMDVYLPQQSRHAPVIFMVHGGAWRLGDKDARTVVENKRERWVPRGFIFVAVNYRMLPDAAPLEQAKDVALAIAAAQAKAASWGGDPGKFIVIGHSAGAHLVALLSASPKIAEEAGAKPWLGAVLLDSAALDVTAIMRARHLRLYDRAFGADPAYWRAVSPSQVLTAGAPPMLAVCSARRTDSCPQARRFIDKAKSLGLRAAVLEEDLSHLQINELLGVEGAYTDAVERFMAGLDESAQRRLVHTPSEAR
jgi:acetyl esterase/lipase